MKGVQLTKLVQELGLHNLTPEIDLSEIVIKTAEMQPPPGRRSGRHHRRSDDLHPGTFPGKNARKLTFAPRTMKVAR